MSTDTTPAPIGADAALAKLRHLYRNLIEGGVRDTAQAKRIAEGLLAPAITALERAALASAAQPADVDSDRAMRAQAAPAAVAGPSDGWPQASAADNALGWTLDYKFLEKVEALAKTRTEYGASMEATEQVLIAALEVLAAAPKAEPAPAINAGDAVFAFASMLTALPHAIPFGAAAWATPGVELATAFNAANGFSVSQNFPDGLVFPKITGDLLAVVEKAAAPVAQGDAEDAASWRVINEQFIDDYLEDYELIGEAEGVGDCCYTPAETERYLIKDAVMGLLAVAEDAARAQAKEGASHG